jgi:septum formation protein
MKNLYDITLTLASASPRRASILSRIRGLRFTVVPSDIDESADFSLPPDKIVEELAERKAADVFKKTGGAVLGADTLVFIDGRALGKPCGDAEAEEFFRLLCGRTHEVHTGICLKTAERTVKKSEKTLVTFSAFNEKIVYNYIRSGLYRGKAGGYGIQDARLTPLIERVDGSVTNVMGLPLGLVKAALKEIAGG